MNTKVKGIENELLSITGLGVNTTRNAKVIEIGNKIYYTTNLSTIAALNESGSKKPSK